MTISATPWTRLLPTSFGETTPTTYVIPDWGLTTPMKVTAGFTPTRRTASSSFEYFDENFDTGDDFFPDCSDTHLRLGSNCTGQADFWRDVPPWDTYPRFACPPTVPTEFGTDSYTNEFSVGYRGEHENLTLLFGYERMTFQLAKMRGYIQLPPINALRDYLCALLGKPLPFDGAPTEFQFSFDEEGRYPIPDAIWFHPRDDADSTRVPLVRWAKQFVIWEDLDQEQSDWFTTEDPTMLPSWDTQGNFSWDDSGMLGDFPTDKAETSLGIDLYNSYLSQRWFVDCEQPARLVVSWIATEERWRDPLRDVDEVLNEMYHANGMYLTFGYNVGPIGGPNEIKYRTILSGTGPLKYKHIDYPLNPVP